MSKQDTYNPGQEKSFIERLDPQEERLLREAELVYNDILGHEEKPVKPLEDALADAGISFLEAEDAFMSQ